MTEGVPGTLAIAGLHQSVWEGTERPTHPINLGIAATVAQAANVAPERVTIHRTRVVKNGAANFVSYRIAHRTAQRSKRRRLPAQVYTLADQRKTKKALNYNGVRAGSQCLARSS